MDALNSGIGAVNLGETQQVEFVVAIPARFASTRLAGKPLVMVGDKPMIAQVCLKALQSTATDVIACIDHEKIAEALQPYTQQESRLKICMTSDKPRSGTERIAEMISLRGLSPETIVVNVQGDEPLITPEHITQVATLLARSGSDMATLCAPITNVADVFDPNCVKVVMDQQQRALYFSRAPIPFERDNFMAWQKAQQVNKENTEPHTVLAFGSASLPQLEYTHYHHIGIYAYRVRTIVDYLQRAPALLEQAESLEQLRLLHYGMSIAVAITDRPPETGVDTAADLERVNKIFAQQH